MFSTFYFSIFSFSTFSFSVFSFSTFSFYIFFLSIFSLSIFFYIFSFLYFFFSTFSANPGTLTFSILSEFVLLSHSVPRLISLFTSSRLLQQQTLFRLKQPYIPWSANKFHRPHTIKLCCRMRRLSMVLVLYTVYS